jgi:hypothetical protein
MTRETKLVKDVQNTLRALKYGHTTTHHAAEHIVVLVELFKHKQNEKKI